MTTQLETTIAEMLTENTGTHMLDSGGSNGRSWQRNAGKTADHFKAQPSATVEIYVREYKGELTADVMPCVDVFHLLTSGALELDDLCKEFNAMPVEDWDGWTTSGVSISGQGWLDKYQFQTVGDGFNTYNWSANHSTVMQGQELSLEGEYGEEKYLLLQIHGGADVRGGYTDARLFKLDDHAELYNVLTEDCGFSCETGDNSLSWYGEWINADGGMADDSELLAFAIACGATVDTGTINVAGDAYLDY
jgi:hypothetical protein